MAKKERLVLGTWNVFPATDSLLPPIFLSSLAFSLFCVAWRKRNIYTDIT